MAKFKWNPDKTVSITAIFVSLLTLCVLVYQTSILREQQRLSVLPYLQMYNQNTGSANYRFMIKNSGIGPAFIESITIKHEGETYETDLPRFLIEHVPAYNRLRYVSYSNLTSGQLISPGEEIKIISVQNSQADADSLFKILVELEIDFELVYASAYKERWRLTDKSFVPEALD